MGNEIIKIQLKGRLKVNCLNFVDLVQLEFSITVVSEH